MTGIEDPHAEPSAGPATLTHRERAYVMATLMKLSGDQADTAARLSVVEDRVEDLASVLDSIEDADLAAGSQLAGVPDLAAAPPGGGQDGDHDRGEAESLDLGELVAWVRDHVALLLERKLPQTGSPPHWCRKWWMHAEAIARFEALRRCWAEAVTGEGSAMVVYFEHLDQQMAVLMGDGGPFTSCVRGDHRSGVGALGHDEPDPGYFARFELLLDTAS